MGASSHYIPKNILKRLTPRSDLWGIYLCVHVWFMIIAAINLYIIWPNPVTFIIAFLIVGSYQHGLAILMHDCAHGILFKTKALNEFFGKYILAPPYGGDLQSYRKYHLKHHRYTQSSQDPDLPLSNKFPVVKQSIIRKFLRDISGLTFLRLQLYSHRRKSTKTETHSRKNEAMNNIFPQSNHLNIYISNLVIFCAFMLAGHGWLYLGLWLLPLMTWFLVVIRIRNIAEHALTSHDDNPLTHARTTYTNFFGRLLFAPYWVNYHIEHHAYMYVPCYRLKALHKYMCQAGLRSQMEIGKGYFSVLKTACIPARPMA